MVIGVDVGQLSPHAGLSAYDVDPLVTGCETVELSPGDVGTVIHSVSVAKTHVEIGLVVVGQDDLVGSSD